MIRLLLLFSALIYSHFALASYPPMPDKCPGINAIQATPFDRIVKQPNANNLWTAQQFNKHYDTTDDWSMSITNIEAQNETEALNQAKAIVTTFRIHDGPNELDDDFRWECIYTSKQGLVSVITPSMPS